MATARARASAAVASRPRRVREVARAATTARAAPSRTRDRARSTRAWWSISTRPLAEAPNRNRPRASSPSSLRARSPSDDDDDDDDGAREDDASASKFSTSSRLLQLLPRVDDVDLLVGDVVVLWLYSLTQKVASVAASSSFPGWLARVSLNPSSLSSWLSESGWIIATWTFTSTCLGAYAIGNENARAGSVLSIEDGEMREAVLGAAKGWAAWSVPAAAGLAWLSEHQELHTSFPLGTELGCVLGVMISWRAYVKVIGLMGWWREGRTRSEREEEDWKFFFDALAAAAVVAVAGGVLDFVLAGGGEWGGSSW